MEQTLLVTWTGTNDFERCFVELIHGTLSWYASVDAVSPLECIHLEAYDLLPSLPRLNNDRAGHDVLLQLKRRADAAQLFGTGPGFALARVNIRAANGDVALHVRRSICAACADFSERSTKYNVAFAGRRLLRLPQTLDRRDILLHGGYQTRSKAMAIAVKQKRCAAADGTATAGSAAATAGGDGDSNGGGDDNGDDSETVAETLTMDHGTMSAESLVLAPLRPLVLEIAVPDNLWRALSPALRRGSTVRVRPVLLTQGISGNLFTQGGRSLFSKDILQFRNEVNENALSSFYAVIKDLKDMSVPSCRPSEEELRHMEILWQELNLRQRRSAKEPTPMPGLLLLAADLANALGAVKMTNCMSGKDRTGMSVTLEQARLIAAHHQFLPEKSRMRAQPMKGTGGMPRVRRDDQLVTLQHSPKKPPRVLLLADLFRACGPRVQICRKCIGKAYFKGMAACECFRPPKAQANNNVEA